MTSFEEHLTQVEQSFVAGDDPRLVEIMQAAIRHLHAFVVETGLTREEWMAGIEFLTAVGQMCDAQRQEFILLSDTLGVSMLVEMVNQGAAPGATEPTVFGPFHVEGAPHRQDHGSIVLDDPEGEPLEVRGVVRGIDGRPIVGASLDVWQTASNGMYDVQDPTQPEMNLRGVFTTGDDGRYAFQTVRPVDYRIPSDGPVGRMLSATARGDWRPAHVHFKVTASGYKPLVTHVFDSRSAHLDRDAVFGVRESLVIDMDGGQATFDIVLEPDA